VRRDAERVWTTVELIRWTADYLVAKGVPEARLTAELLLADALRCKRLDLYLQFERPLAPAELADFKERLRRRVKREPIQYIAGTAAFRELTLHVDPRVLIPRPETELLVGEVLAWAGDRRGLDVVDVGTGSGAIALSLRLEGDFGRVVATDLSPGALEVARANAELTGLSESVEFLEGSVLDPLRGQMFDVIVSNPPYIGEAERSGLAPEVVDWEPSMALFAGPEGMTVIDEIIRTGPSHLRRNGLVALEIGAGQAEAVARRVVDSASFTEPRVVRDLSGRDRIVLFERL
jgi:release factor glutamine methyltransferase